MSWREERIVDDRVGGAIHVIDRKRLWSLLILSILVWSLLVAPLAIWHYHAFHLLVATLIYSVVWVLGAAALYLLWRSANAWMIERAAADEKVRQLYRAVEHSPASIVITDKTGSIEYVNPKFTEATGYTSEEALGKNPRVLKSGRMRADDYKELWETILSGRDWRGEFLNVKKSGEEYWESASISPIRNADGVITHFVAVKEDITERKRLELERTALLSVIENTDDLVTVKDLDLRIVAANRAFLQATGNESIAEALGKTDAEVFGLEENAEPVVTYMADDRAAQLLPPGKVIVREEPVLFSDGNEHTLLTRKYPIHDAAGCLIGTGNISVDITERIGAEAVLRTSEARLRAITESAQDAIIVIDPDGSVSFWNSAAESILGYAADEALGSPVHALLAPHRFREKHAMAFPAFQATGMGNAIGKTIDLQARRKDGQEIHVQLSLSAFEMNDGWHAVGILRDTTEQKRTEENLLAMNVQLEQATARANEMAAQAEMANAAKSEFLANMSHEIRTPMNGVIGMTGLLLDTALSEEQRQYAEIVRSSAEALLTLLNDILDFSKIEAKKLELESIDFDLVLAVESTAELLAVGAQTKGLDLVCVVEPDVPALLRGDPGRLRQILLNLGGNAVKFTQEGSITIQATLESETDAQVAVKFTVSDTGIGVSSDKLERLFQPFTQADGSTTRKYGGTGLGLAISKQLAELMGGEIGAECRPDRGSTFWFTARFDKQPDDGLLRTVPVGELAGVRVLVVDDLGINRSLLHGLLSRWGCQFGQAADAQSALGELRNAVCNGDPYGIALIDMQMPGVDGEELGRRIKGDASIAGTRLIIMTSLAQRGQAQRLRLAGYSGYLTKPVRQNQLRECMQLVMGRPDSDACHGGRDLVTRHTVSEAKKRRVRILVAEDNTVNQMVALKTLGKLGYRADAVGSGLEVLESLRRMPYDLVLMDCQMPGMDGFEATRIVRSWKTNGHGERGPRIGAKTAQVPIIAMTAHAMQGDRERCLAAGMDDYICKPVKPDNLLAVLERWLVNADGIEKDLNMGVRDRPEQPEAPAPQHDSTRVFDPDAFVERLMGDVDLAKSIVGDFLTDMTVQVASLGRAVAEGDTYEAERRAHAIHGASANVGGEVLRRIVADVEQAAKNNDIEGIAAMFPHVERAFLELEDRMDSWLGV